MLTNCNSELELPLISPCSQKEADTRLLLHSSLCDDGAAIWTVDTDVLVISTGVFHDLKLDQLWVEIGYPSSIKFPVHAIAERLGKDVCKALLFFHAFTGCDTVSSFFHIGKNTSWKVFLENKALFTEVFDELSRGKELDDKKFTVVEKFVCLLYKQSSQNDVDSCRLAMHSKGVTFDRLPPTKSALLLHTKRAMLQSYIWRHSLEATPPNKDPIAWGWKKYEDKNSYYPHWSSLPAAVTLVDHFKKCSCNVKCTSRCSCKKNNLKCTSLCKCDYELCNHSISVSS